MLSFNYLLDNHTSSYNTTRLIFFLKLLESLINGGTIIYMTLLELQHGVVKNIDLPAIIVC